MVPKRNPNHIGRSTFPKFPHSESPYNTSVKGLLINTVSDYVRYKEVISNTAKNVITFVALLESMPHFLLGPSVGGPF